MFFNSFLVLASLQSLFVRGQTSVRTERLFVIVPVFSCGSKAGKISRAEWDKWGARIYYIPFLRIPFVGSAGVADTVEDMAGKERKIVDQVERRKEAKLGKGLCERWRAVDIILVFLGGGTGRFAAIEILRKKLS